MVPDPTRHGTRNIIQKEICIIEDLLKEAGTLQDSAIKQRHTQKIAKLISETKSKLMARFWDSPSDDGDATEHDTLWTILDNATFNNTRLLIQCLELGQDRGTVSESNTKETKVWKRDREPGNTPQRTPPPRNRHHGSRHHSTKKPHLSDPNDPANR